MLRHLGWLFGLSRRRSRRAKTLDAKPYIDNRVKPVLMVDTVQEVAIYIHRFHNLDLFQQGYVTFLCLNSTFFLEKEF